MIKKLSRIILTFIATLIMSLSPLQTFADHDEAFYSGNDILYYNQDDCPADSSGEVSSNAVAGDAAANAKSIFEFLISTNFTTNGNKPMTAIQAAGVLGNIQSESGFNPGAIQHPPFNQTSAMNASIDNGFGIAQWSFGRRVNLMNFSAQQGTQWSDLNTQLKFLANELNTTHNVFSTAFGAANTPSAAATLWNQKFEVSADTSSKRLTQAEQWYNQFKSLAPVATGDSSDSSNCESKSGTGSGQCSATSCTTGDGTAASVVSAAMSMVLPTREAGIAACNQYCGHGPAQPASYAQALKQYIPPAVANNYYGACCATFVSTVLQVAGVENNFASCGAAAVHSYLASHPDLFKHVASGVTSVAGLQPGDILSDDGDVYIYIGGNNVAGASYQERMPDIQAAWFDGPRDVYRVIKGGA